MWTRHWSNSKNAPYWHHSGSGATTWLQPAEQEGDKQGDDKQGNHKQGGKQGQEQGASSGEWVERFSSSKQARYWVNTATNASTWTRPASLGPREEESESESDKKRRRVDREREQAAEVTAQQSAAFQAQLDAERRRNQLPDPALPR